MQVCSRDIVLYRHAKGGAIHRPTWLIPIPIHWRISTDIIPRDHGFAFLAFA
jgi:hypothetical protein